MTAPLGADYRICSRACQGKRTSLEAKEGPQSWPLGWSPMRRGQFVRVLYANLSEAPIPQPAPASLTGFLCPLHPSLAHSSQTDLLETNQFRTPGLPT